ncbi:CPBP family intramembrane glutamic endopeptidase [Streptococcus sobrinus]|uniref:CPBP family intramembrane glutamic endopeptidase n=1 Tax=Streptococcus sobrinus TaxID=1310 RepID=UPI00030419CF|nr:type II CAAX endopeptidase family protein [Streptococcus sobrinus]
MKIIRSVSLVIITFILSILIQLPTYIVIQKMNQAGLDMKEVFIALIVACTIFFLLFLLRQKILRKKHLPRKPMAIWKILLRVIAIFTLELLANSILIKLGLYTESGNNQAIIKYLFSDKFYFMLFATNLMAPILEELLFRGFLQEILLQLFPKSEIIVVLLVAFYFAFLHTYSFNFNLFGYLISGLYFTLIYWKTRTIKYSIIAHIGFNSLITVVALIFH